MVDFRNQNVTSSSQGPTLGLEVTHFNLRNPLK